MRACRPERALAAKRRPPIVEACQRVLSAVRVGVRSSRRRSYWRALAQVNLVHCGRSVPTSGDGARPPCHYHGRPPCRSTSPNGREPLPIVVSSLIDRGLKDLLELFHRLEDWSDAEGLERFAVRAERYV